MTVRTCIFIKLLKKIDMKWQKLIEIIQNIIKNLKRERKNTGGKDTSTLRVSKKKVKNKYEKELDLIELQEPIDLRDKLAKENLEKSQLFLPDGAWGIDYKNSVEVDGSIRNIHTSYNLLAEKDPNIIKKLRF